MASSIEYCHKMHRLVITTLWRNASRSRERTLVCESRVCEFGVCEAGVRDELSPRRGVSAQPASILRMKMRSTPGALAMRPNSSQPCRA